MSLGKDIGALLVVHALSRAIYRLCGGRFDASEIGSFWHFLPADLLKEKLSESLFYSHFQPPLFNLYLGLTLKLFGDRAPLAFEVGYLIAGAAGISALYVLMRVLGAARAVALVLAGIFSITPAMLLFESYLFYTLPLAVALILAALLLHVAVVRQRAVWWGAFFGVLAAIVLCRTLFHPLWLAAIVAVASYRARSGRRRVLVGAGIPLALVLAVCLKNWVVFDSFGTTTWLGLGLSRMTVRNLAEPERERMIAEGRLSALCRIRPPGTVADYQPLVPESPTYGVPLLDRPTKPGGAVNLHHRIYVQVSRQLRSDSLVALREHPGVFAGTARDAFGHFLAPAASWHPLAPNRRAIAAYADAHDALVHFGGLFRKSGLLLFVFPSVAALALWWTLRRAGTEPARWVGAFAASTIVYVTLVGCLLEPNENMRFRFMIEPLLWTFGALLLTEAIASIRRISAARSQALEARWR
jgi:hypothetical protein